MEITGTNGTGKSSVIEAIRYALTNSSRRDVLIHKGDSEGEILIETDTGLHINRKARDNMSDFKKIKENGKDIASPEAFLREIFTPLQLDPVEFTRMTKAEQKNKIILGLIEFDWDMNWIVEQPGEIPPKVDYAPSTSCKYSMTSRLSGKLLSSSARTSTGKSGPKRGVAETIAQDIPPEYQAEKWEQV